MFRKRQHIADQGLLVVVVQIAPLADLLHQTELLDKPGNGRPLVLFERFEQCFESFRSLWVTNLLEHAKHLQFGLHRRNCLLIIRATGQDLVSCLDRGGSDLLAVLHELGI